MSKPGRGKECKQLGCYKKKKVDCFVESRLRFSKVLDLQKLTGRFPDNYRDRTLDMVGDGPFNQLSNAKLAEEKRRNKSITARFCQFGFLPGQS